MDDDTDPFLMPLWLRRELIRNGCPDREIAQRLRSREWVRPRRGAYTPASAWAPLDAAARHVVTTRAVVKQANTDVVVSHSSAVPWWGGTTWGLDLDFVHITRRDGKTGRKEAGVHEHCGLILAEDVVTRHGVAIMSPTRTALEVSTLASLEVAVVVLNDLLHRKLTTPAAVRERYDKSMERWPDTRATEIVIRLGDPRIASVLESRFWTFCYLAGLPAPIPQYEVRTPDGHLVAVLDFAWPAFGAYVETNGKSKYLELLEPDEKPGDVIQRERRREELVNRLTGLRALHVDWDDLSRPRVTEQRVRDHLWPAESSAS